MIIECKECDGKVSTTAVACPHCGAPVEGPPPAAASTTTASALVSGPPASPSQTVSSEVNGVETAVSGNGRRVARLVAAAIVTLALALVVLGVGVGAWADRVHERGERIAVGAAQTLVELGKFFDCNAGTTTDSRGRPVERSEQDCGPRPSYAEIEKFEAKVEDFERGAGVDEYNLGVVGRHLSIARTASDVIVALGWCLAALLVALVVRAARRRRVTTPSGSDGELPPLTIALAVTLGLAVVGQGGHVTHTARSPDIASALRDPFRSKKPITPPLPPMDLPSIDLPSDAREETSTNSGAKVGAKAGTTYVNPCSATCSGTITDEVRSVVSARANAAKQCYRTAIVDGEALAGDMNFTLVVGPSGQTCSVTITSDTTGSRKLQQCVRQRLGAAYPAPKGGCASLSGAVSFRNKGG